MANKKHGKDSYLLGPYKGSADNGGRPIYVRKYKDANGNWKTSSTTKARAEFESRNGKLPKGTEVDHKDNNKKNDSPGNLRAISKSENVAKENKRRAGKPAAKPTPKKKK